MILLVDFHLWTFLMKRAWKCISLLNMMVYCLLGKTTQSCVKKFLIGLTLQKTSHCSKVITIYIYLLNLTKTRIWLLLVLVLLACSRKLLAHLHWQARPHTDFHLLFSEKCFMVRGASRTEICTNNYISKIYGGLVCFYKQNQALPFTDPVCFEMTYSILIQ